MQSRGEKKEGREKETRTGPERIISYKLNTTYELRDVWGTRV